MLSLQQMLSQQDTEFSNTIAPRSRSTGFLLFIMYLISGVLLQQSECTKNEINLKLKLVLGVDSYQSKIYFS